jgi:DNA-binding CsgD family transcriptional regulator
MTPHSRLADGGRLTAPAPTREPPATFAPTSDRAPTTLAGPMTMTLGVASSARRAVNVRATWGAFPSQDPTRPALVIELSGDLDWSDGTLRLSGTVASRVVPDGGPAWDERRLAAVRCLRLTRREAEVAALLAGGGSNADIAVSLGISPHTARRHTESVMLKLRARTRAQVGPILHGDRPPASTPAVPYGDVELFRRPLKDR